MNTEDFHTADPCLYGQLKVFARQLRNNPTEAEQCLWLWLKGGFYGRRFRRQHIIADYIVDFACLESKLIIEIDGGYHRQKDQQAYDAMRTQRLERLGYKVLRFTNEEVIAEPQIVTNKIKESLV